MSVRTRGAVRCALVLVLAVVACGDPPPARATLSVTGILADADTAGFQRADRPRDFVFPRDHGPHPGFRHEWWYFTGNVEDATGRPFGFQFTIFRSALRPDTADLASPWATNQAYMAHFALAEPAAGRFRAFERFDRGALGLAGAATRPFRVHVGDWEVTFEPPDDGAPPTVADDARPFPPFRIRAAADDVAMDLRLEPVKPVVLQGDDGLSLKGPEPGNASYYYSLTRLAARGTVEVDGRPAPVRGWAWLDREWGTSALGPELEGWDWFALQLDDDTELMYYRFRRQDGETDPLSRGSFVHPDGRVTPLRADDVVLEPAGRWRSPRGGDYPSGWRLRVPALGLELGIDPLLDDQEVDLSFRYWEGAVAVDGNRGGAPVSGRGYVELTGYAERVAATSRGSSSGTDRPSTGRPSTKSSR
jgi:predicted secreted hydrolase